MKKFKRINKIVGIVIALWFVGKIVGCVFLIPGPWGPIVKGDLPSGGFVEFQARCVGKETDDRLTWVDKQGTVQQFWVDRIHAGFGHVVIKISDDGKGIWVESDGKVGASLDLTTGDFRDELSMKHSFAVYGEGTTIADGNTWGFLQVLCPF